MRLATWQRVAPPAAGYGHAAHAIYEREDVSARAYLFWNGEVGWDIVIRIESDGRRPREVGRFAVGCAYHPPPEIGEMTFALMDEMAERGTR